MRPSPAVLLSSSLLLLAVGCSKGDPTVRAKAAFDAGDFKQALVLAMEPAKKGDPKAQVLVGLIFADGKGVEADGQTAVAWFRKAAEAGYPPGQYDLAMMLEAGEGVSAPDPEGAYKWYSAAAAQGDEPAKAKVKELDAERGAKNGRKRSRTH